MDRSSHRGRSLFKVCVLLHQGSAFSFISESLCQVGAVIARVRHRESSPLVKISFLLISGKCLLNQRTVEIERAISRNRRDIKHINLKEELSSRDVRREKLREPNLLANARPYRGNPTHSSGKHGEERTKKKKRRERKGKRICFAPSDTNQMSCSPEEDLRLICKWLNELK